MVRALMIQRAISVQSLAVACGVTARTMANQIAASFPSRRLRCVVENYLGVAVWTTPGEFARRQTLVKNCGVDLIIQTAPKIRQMAESLKIRGRGNRRRANLISLIEKHLTTTTPNPRP